MICPICFGRKYDFKKDGNSGYFVECKKCHGTGIVEPQTNEEWFCGLSTEEKARFITRYGIRRQVLHSFETVGDSIKKSTDRHLGTTDIFEPIEEWLKQPRKE